MKKEERIAMATEAFRKDYNCTHSVLLGYPDLLATCRESVLKQASGFGGGMGRLQEVCGAVTGAFMVIGLLRGTTVPDAHAKDIMAGYIQRFAAEFSKRHGTINCRELIGVDLNTAEGKETHRGTGIRERVCEKCIADAIAIVEEIIAE